MDKLLTQIQTLQNQLEGLVISAAKLGLMPEGYESSKWDGMAYEIKSTKRNLENMKDRILNAAAPPPPVPEEAP